MKMYNVLFEDIHEVEVERKTDSSVWILGNRKARYSAWSSYYDTYEQAKESVLKKAESKVKKYESQLESAKHELEELRLKL